MLEMAFCENCGKELADGLKFCPVCGEKTGLPLDPPVAAAIDPTNAKTTKKGKKKFTIPIVAAAVVVLALGGIIINHSVQAKKVAEYIEKAGSFNYQVLQSAAKMEQIGNKIEDYWNNHIWYNGYFKDGDDYVQTSSIDDAIDKAQAKMATELSYVKIYDISIQQSCQELRKVPDSKDEDLLEIKAAVLELYDEYTALYDCVVTPVGSYNSWTSDFSDADSATLKKYNALKNILDFVE